MSRSLILMLLSSLALVAAGCPKPEPQPVNVPVVAPHAEPSPDAEPQARQATREASEEDICADKQPTGDPPVCPQGCIWSSPKQKCIQSRGVIVDQLPEEPLRNPRVTPTPVRTLSPTSAPVPTSAPAPALTPSK